MLKANSEATTASDAGVIADLGPLGSGLWAQVDEVQSWIDQQAKGAATAYHALVYSLVEGSTAPGDATAAADFLSEAFLRCTEDHSATLSRVMDQLAAMRSKAAAALAAVPQRQQHEAQPMASEPNAETGAALAPVSPRPKPRARA